MVRKKLDEFLFFLCYSILEIEDIIPPPEENNAGKNFQ
jgi:hypothetical protein